MNLNNYNVSELTRNEAIQIHGGTKLSRWLGFIYESTVEGLKKVGEALGDYAMMTQNSPHTYS